MTRLDDLADARRLDDLQRRYWLAPKGARKARLKELRDATHAQLARDVRAKRRSREKRPC